MGGAIGVMLGLVVLHQHPSASQIAGIILVIFAGTAAQHGGRRSRKADGVETLSELDILGDAPA